MRNCIIIIGLVFFAGTLQGQEYKLITNSAPVKQAIQKQHSTTKTLSADFIEEVHSAMFNKPQKGNGTLLYKQSDKIRWENTSAKQIILLNGSSVKMSENGKLVSSPTTNKIVKKIQGMMLSMLSGNFLNEKEFNIQYFENSSNYKLILAPKSPRMSKYIQKIELQFNKQTLLLSQMNMIESKDQELVYIFSNTKLNAAINESKFNQF